MAAILLGLVAGWVVAPAPTLARLLVTAAFLGMAAATGGFALEGRREAVRMERYWFRMRLRSHLEPSAEGGTEQHR